MSVESRLWRSIRLGALKLFTLLCFLRRIEAEPPASTMSVCEIKSDAESSSKFIYRSDS